MSFDALTVAAIIIIVVFVGVLVRVCTLLGNACNGGNEYLSIYKDESRDEQEDSV